MILKLPKGYQTPISMAGRGLSGGQAQRVALARSVYRDPPICVFDEPDAHVDAESERALLGLLQTLKTRKATTVLIGHRAGLMRFVDRLVVLEGGVVASVKTAEQPQPALGGADA
jgi:ABC-type protease/lipase transport system fused ATPase/permease subunit